MQLFSQRQFKLSSRKKLEGLRGTILVRPLNRFHVKIEYIRINIDDFYYIPRIQQQLNKSY